MRIIPSYLSYSLGLLAGLWYFCFNMIGLDFTHIPGDLGDARFNNYLLEHAHRFFTLKTGEFWNAPFMYPEKDVISYSDNLLGAAPFYSLFRLLGAEREMAFQLWFLLMCVLNYTACYFFLRFLIKNNYSAALGAMIFTFSTALYSQMPHAQTYPRFAIPLAVWAMLLYTRELKPKYFFISVMLLVYQFYCGIYLGFLLFIPLAVLFGSTVFLRFGHYKRLMKQSQWWLRMALSGMVGALTLLPIILPYVERAKQIGFYSYETIIQSLPTAISFMYSQHGTLFWDFLAELGVHYPAFWDHQLFPGGIALLCLIAFFVLVTVQAFKKKMFSAQVPEKDFLILLITIFITFLLFIRFGDFSLYRILFELPGYGSLRALQRVVNVELLFFAIAVSFLSQFILRKEGITGFVMFMVLGTLIVCDNYLRPDFSARYEVETSKQRIVETIQKINTAKQDNALSAAKTIISYEPDTLTYAVIYYHLDAMLASQSMSLKSLNGYSATSPVGFDQYWVKPNETTRMIWLNTKNLPMDSVLVIR